MANSVERLDFAVDRRMVDELAPRLDKMIWPAEPPSDSSNVGISGEELRALVDYWRHGYDWDAQEARLKALPHYAAEIDGQTIHFIHVRSGETDALPILLTHGWPSSFLEFVGIINALTDPVSHGGSREDAFHVVIPSLPGFTLSAPLASAGWTARRISTAWRTLMSRLGYERYGVHGGDWGSLISRDLGAIDADHVVGAHLAYLVTPPISELPSEASDLDRARLEKLKAYMAKQPGYWRAQATQPQTLAYGLTDSPVAQLAWIAQRFKDWTDPACPVDRDAILTNVMLYWLTGTAGSSARIYFEAEHAPRPAEKCTVPVGVCVFPRDIVQPVRSFAEASLNITRWTESKLGGHFPAWEVPDFLVSELRAFFRSLR